LTVTVTFFTIVELSVPRQLIEYVVGFAIGYAVTPVELFVAPPVLKPVPVHDCVSVLVQVRFTESPLVIVADDAPFTLKVTVGGGEDEPGTGFPSPLHSYVPEGPVHVLTPPQPAFAGA